MSEHDDTTPAQLIPVKAQRRGNLIIHEVDGRTFHAFMEIPTQFSMWIQRRIDEYGFVQDIDFSETIFGDGPTKTIEYALTLDMAKELAMVERTPKGREARQYFIKIEKAYQQQRSVRKPRAQKPLTPAKLKLEEAKLALMRARLELAEESYNRLMAANELAVQGFDATLSLSPPEPPPQLSVIQWLDDHSYHLSLPEENLFGRLCAKLSREKGRSIGQAADRRWKNPDGSWKRINAYDEDIIEEAWKLRKGEL